MTDIELMAYSQEEHDLTMASNQAALNDIVFDMADMAGAEQIITDLKLLIEKLEARIN